MSPSQLVLLSKLTRPTRRVDQGATKTGPISALRIAPGQNPTPGGQGGVQTGSNPLSLANCPKCPFATDGKPSRPVLGESLGAGRFVLVGEGPGEQEVAQGRPFVGYTGGMLNDELVGVRLNRRDAIVLNATACRPRGTKDTPRMATAVRCCRPRLLEELRQFIVAAAASSGKGIACRPPSTSCLDRLESAPGANMVLALGTWAAAAILGKRGNIDTLRGPVRTVPGWGHVIATFHPARCLPKRDPRALGPFRVDLARFARLVGGASVPNPVVRVDPPAAEIVALHRSAVAIGHPVALDVETIGTVGRSWEALSPKYARLRAVGLGVLDLGLSVRWPPPSDAHKRALVSILADESVLKVLHNRSFDLPILARHGLVVQ